MAHNKKNDILAEVFIFNKAIMTKVRNHAIEESAKKTGIKESRRVSLSPIERAMLQT